MKLIGKVLCITLTVLMLILLIMTYLINPFLLSNCCYAQLFILIMLESSLYYTLSFIAWGIAIICTFATIEALYTRLMKRLGIE